MSTMPIDPKPCPFCGWANIRVMESTRNKGILKGEKYTYSWCKACGAKGPWIYNATSSMEENYKGAVQRWNDRK